MEQALLSDNRIRPTEELIYSHIGKSKALWELLFDYIHECHPDFTAEWRYYMDGKRWLMKVCRKSKTIFWLSILPGSFRTTFYLTDRAAGAIAQSTLSAELKKQFREGPNKIRGITIVYKAKRDVDYARQLIEIKTAL